MSGFKPPPQKHTETEDWLMSYADMITLLLGFFVMIIAISKIDPVKLEQVQDSISKNISKQDAARPMEQLKIDLQDLVMAMKLDDKVSIGADSDGLVMDLATNNLFEPGSAEIRPDMLMALQKIGVTLNGPRFQAFQIEVQGHTDDVPVSNERYPTNWELSAARATAALRVFLQSGVTPLRMKAVGFADVMPKVPNRDAAGNPLPINQSVNRRVAVRVYPR